MMSVDVRFAFVDLEKTLFNALETESWTDTLFCIVAYMYVFSFAIFAFFFPLAFFVYLFLLSPY